MSDMHILVAGADGEYEIVMHFTVPPGNNSVGVPWSIALVNSMGNDENGNPLSPRTALRDGVIDAAEKSAIEVGTVVEHIVTFRAESGGTANAQIRASVRAFFASEKSAVFASLAIRLKYFGHTESEA